MSAEPTADSANATDPGCGRDPRHRRNPRRGRDWARAGRALRTLIRDPERTDAVFDLIEALDRADDEAEMRALRSRAEAARLLRERPQLLAALSNRAALAALPEGSLGRAYHDFARANGIAPEGLVEADEGRDEHRTEPDADAAYLSQRGRDCHDLWHVLTGYGTDEAGEVALLSFSCGQYGSLGLRLIVLTGALLGPRTLGLRWERYLWRAYRRGRRAHLDCAPYEEWLPRPLAEVRRLARIDPPEIAHPGGIVVASRPRGAASGRDGTSDLDAA